MIRLTLALAGLLALPRQQIQIVSATTLFLLSFVGLPILIAEKRDAWFFLDRLSTPLILLTLWISALILLARDKISPSDAHLFTKTITLLATILVIVFASRTLLGFYISFEAALLPTLFLILTWGYQPERLQAGIYLILYTVTASLPLLVGRILARVKMGTTAFCFPHWASPDNLVPPLFWWFMIITAFLAKIPMYSLHLWLPKAHVEAPVAGSIILAGILLKLGGYGILRISMLVQSLNLQILSFIASLSLLGGVISAMICIRQTDLKALVAYSSVTHMAIIIAAILTNSQWAWQGALCIIIAHGLVSSALFALCNSCYALVKTRRLFLTKGLISISPLMSFIWFLSLAANIGAPPSINLQREIMITIRILWGSSLFAGLLALSLFLSAAYCLHMFVATQHGRLRTATSGLLPITPRTTLCIFLHVLPAFLLILKTEPFSCWL